MMNYALGRDILFNFAKGSIDGEGTLANLSRYFGSYGENVTAMGFIIWSVLMIPDVSLPTWGAVIWVIHSTPKQ